MKKLRQIFFPNTTPIQLPKNLPEAEREARRVIRFNRTHNFRDLGGYVGVNGRRTKWGTLYRSDNLHRLNATSHTLFDQLNLHTLIDFRSRFEKSVEPNKLPEAHNVKVIEIPILDQGNKNMGKSLQERIRKGDVADLDGAALMLGANRQFVEQYTAEYTQFIRHVLDANGQPVLFHCTGGKDRTGFAAAILLRLLGVSEEQIMEDYLMSNSLILPALKRRFQLYALLRGRRALAVVEALARVTPEYLGTALDAIDELYGDFTTYAADGLGLSDGDIARLRENLLED